MDNKTDQNLEAKDKLVYFFKKYKIKIISFILIFLILIVSIIFFNFIKEKQDKKISEKYIQAGLYLASEEKDKAKEVLEEIVMDKHKFYSILALNSILEQNLDSKKSEILQYFSIVEKLNLSKDQYDLVTLKKALFLLKNAEEQKGKDLLDTLIQSNSNLKSLAEEIRSN